MCIVLALYCVFVYSNHTCFFVAIVGLGVFLYRRQYALVALQIAVVLVTTMLGLMAGLMLACI